MKTQTDSVILRRWPPTEGGSVIALLPDVPANPGRVMSYEHVGQHGEADRGIVGRTWPCSANDPDAAALLAELHGLGYRLALRARLPGKARK